MVTGPGASPSKSQPSPSRVRTPDETVRLRTDRASPSGSWTVRRRSFNAMARRAQPVVSARCTGPDETGARLRRPSGSPLPVGVRSRGGSASSPPGSPGPSPDVVPPPGAPAGSRGASVSTTAPWIGPSTGVPASTGGFIGWGASSPDGASPDGLSDARSCPPPPPPCPPPPAFAAPPLSFSGLGTTGDALKSFRFGCGSGLAN